LKYDILIFESTCHQTIGLSISIRIKSSSSITSPNRGFREQALSPWKGHIAELARQENVYCKVSGMVTEASWDAWTDESLGPIWTWFSRLSDPNAMFGSDWPVLTLASTYGRWLSTVQRAMWPLCPPLSRNGYFRNCYYAMDWNKRLRLGAIEDLGKNLSQDEKVPEVSDDTGHVGPTLRFFRGG
jgi:hypothetical protein